MRPRCSHRGQPTVPDFHDRRQQLRDGRAALEAALAALRAAGADESRARAAEASLNRRLDPHDRGHARELAAAGEAVTAAGGSVRQAERDVDAARAAAADAVGSFAQLADPRSRAGELGDGMPVLLLPWRLETRFGGGD